jgi:hypothetical protein
METTSHPIADGRLMQKIAETGLQEKGNKACIYVNFA